MYFFFARLIRKKEKTFTRHIFAIMFCLLHIIAVITKSVAA